jgi:nitric oxide reductase NorD protein
MTSRPPSSGEGRTRARWRAAADRLAAVSAALAHRFTEHTASFVGRADAARLEAWAEAGLRLRTEAGWRGERLAHELFASARDAFPAIDHDDVGRWAALALRCGGELDDATFFRALPATIAGWDPRLRTAWLDVALALPPRLAVVAYRDLPGALERVTAAARPALLAAWHAAAVDGGSAELVELTPLLGALLASVPAPARADAVAALGEVAAAFPSGVPGLLRSLPRLYDEAPPARVREWVAHGLELASRHRAAGIAYFGLASRTSERVLAASPTAATLDDMQGELRRLVHMLSGAPATPRPVAPFRLLPPLEEAARSSMVALAPSIARLDTCEDNARLYRLVAALLAGRREHGTYAVLPDGAGTLRATGRPPAVEHLFLLADGVRVAARLSEAYPGIAGELRWAGEALAGEETESADVYDALFAMALRKDAAHDVPRWLAALAQLVLPSLRALEDPGATAADALRIAERLAVLFPETDRALGLGELPDLVTVLLDAAPGEGAPGGTDDAAGGGPALADDRDTLSDELRDALTLLVDEQLGDAGGAGLPLDPETLRRLVEALGAEALGQSRGDLSAEAGLYVTQLVGKRLSEAADDQVPPATAARDRPRRGPRPAAADAAVFVYDEWDHVIDDYRPAWCELREIELPGDSGLFFDRALARHADLVPEVRRHFQRLRPERYRPVLGLEDGEVIDLNAVVDARVQRRAGQPVSAKLYASRRREERDVATVFLLDMSASTDETAPDASERIIDIVKDALVIMAVALEEIGDLYAVYGFSGQGRDGVEVYPVKAFGERLTPAVQSRIGGLEPRGSTRMGAALRHAAAKMAGVPAPSRHLVLLSDGFPQDLDYGTDRSSHTYGIRDTSVALREVQQAGVRPFCITVDVAGHDYLREMCAPEQYLVIEAVADLPRELPKIYQRLVRAA